MRIGILTGGGDVPGLNACIKAVVDRVAHEGHEVVGLRRGWAALVEIDPDEPGTADAYVQKLDPTEVRTIDRTGGTMLHTSRTNPSNVSRRCRRSWPAPTTATRPTTSPATPCVSSSTWASTC